MTSRSCLCIPQVPILKELVQQATGQPWWLLSSHVPLWPNQPWPWSRGQHTTEVPSSSPLHVASSKILGDEVAFPQPQDQELGDTRYHLEGLQGRRS